MAAEENNVAVQGEGDTEMKGQGKTDTLYIWGLGKFATQPEVKEEFEKFAKVVRVTIIKDKVTQISKGFGYVLCENPEEATKALKEMDGRVLGENPLRVKYSFSGTPDWMKYLDTKPGGERRGRGRGRGYFPGRGRGDHGRGRGGYQYGEDYSNEEMPRRQPLMDDNYYTRKTLMRDDPFGLKPLPYDERRPLPQGSYERRPHESSYERRPVEGGYERRPVEGSYERRPTREDLLYTHDPPDSSRDTIYAPVEKRDIYQERRDLYRPSDDQRYQDPLISRRDDYPGERSLPRSPLTSQPRPPLASQPHPPQTDYRERSPVGRSGGQREYYDNASSTAQNYYGYRDSPQSHTDGARYPPADGARYPPADGTRYPPAAGARYPPADGARYPPPAPMREERHAPVDYRAQVPLGRVSYEETRTIVGKISDPYAQVDQS